MARLNPCPSCKDSFSLSLFSVYAPANRETNLDRSAPGLPRLGLHVPDKGDGSV
jgi:hypothetical protein